jgi:multiple sugar transport system substrate-binding protein
MSRSGSLLRFALVLPALALLIGCGGGDEGGLGTIGTTDTTSTTGSGGATITLQVAGDEPELKAYPELIAAYEQKTGARVNLLRVEKGGNFQKLTTAFAGGDPPDVFLSGYGDFGGFAAKRVLDPVGPHLDASETLRRGAYYPQALKAFEIDGELQCMPQDISSPVVFYNRDAFRAAGIDDPAADWSYDDFVATAKKLKGSLGADRFALGFEPDMERLASFAFSAGGVLVDDPVGPTGFTLDGPATRTGLQSFFSLSRFSPGESVLGSKEPDELFAEGDIAMFVDSRMEVAKLREIEDFKWDVAPFPRIESDATALHSDGYCISEEGDSAAAWRFVEFAAGPEGQKLLAQSGRIVPALKKVAESPAFLAPKLEPRSSRVFLDAIPGMQPLPNSPNWAQVEQAAHGPVEEGFFEAAAKGNAELREVVEEFVRNLNRETADKF